jgi:hypothetical protein
MHNVFLADFANIADKSIDVFCVICEIREKQLN